MKHPCKSAYANKDDCFSVGLKIGSEHNKVVPSGSEKTIKKIRMKTKFFFILIVLCISSTIFPQNIEIRGKVTSKDDGNPLPGVSVVIKGTATAAITDYEGRYLINAPSDALLIFSFVGYISKEITANQSVIDVVLEPEVTEIDEIVVVGYGSALKTDLTGSIAKISSEDMQKVPVSTFESALQGKTPGVFMTSTTGKLGEAFNIRVRGTSSISASNQPLYVVDGIIITSDNIGDPYNQPINPLMTINPNDIKSMQVLKDASAAAIYGSRASNGVVIVETKSGRKGEKSTVNFGYSLTSAKEAHRIDLLNGQEYFDLLLESLENSGYHYHYGYGDNEEALYIFNEILKIDTVKNCDWQDAIFKNALSQEVSLDVSGGSENSTYFAGITYSDQEGILVKNNFNRINGRLNFTNSFNKYFVIAANMSFAKTNLDRVSEDNAYSNPMQLISQSPAISAYLDNGEPNPNTTYFNGLLADKYNKENNRINRIISSATSNINILPEKLKFTTVLGLDNIDQRETIRLSPKTDDGGVSGFGYYRTVNDINYTLDNYFTFTHSFGTLHNVTAVLGSSYQKEQYYRSNMGAKVFPGDEFEDLDAAAQSVEFGSSKFETTFLSYFSRVNYKYNDRYLLGLSYRMDASSRFSENNRWGNFYSVSAGWILSKENFMNSISFVSFLKPRVSYGTTGNANISDFGYLNLTKALPYAGEPGYIADNLGNTNLKWENTAQFDAGLDFGFLKNKITGEFDIYIKNTDDLLLSRPISIVTGYRSIIENIGKLENKGIELAINTTPISGNLQWNIAFNIAYNENTIKKLVEPIFYDVNIATEGEPLGIFFLPEYAGVDPDNGDALYYTADDSLTNDYSEAEYRKVGNPNPKYYGGLSNSLSYKGFDFTVFLQFVADYDVYQLHGMYISVNAAVADNQTKDQLNRWQKPGDITDVPRASFGWPTNGDNPSSRWISDASYMRVKDITLGYTLPGKIINKVYMQSARVYVSAHNILTFTKYTGYDPEVSAPGAGRSATSYNIQQGIDYYSAPQAKSVTFGINITL